MRIIFTWLMVFGVLAGLNVRVLAADAGHATVCSTMAEGCCPNDHGPDPHQDGDHCPQDHHHHSCGCLHALPLTIDSDPGCQLGDPISSLFGVLHESASLPDGPYLGSEKPPLI